MVSAPIAGLNVLRAPIVLAISAMPAMELVIANLVSARASIVPSVLLASILTVLILVLRVAVILILFLPVAQASVRRVIHLHAHVQIAIPPVAIQLTDLVRAKKVLVKPSTKVALLRAPSALIPVRARMALLLVVRARLVPMLPAGSALRVLWAILHILRAKPSVTHVLLLNAR